MAQLSLTAANLDGTIVPAYPPEAVVNGVAMTGGLVVYIDSSRLLQIATNASQIGHRAAGIYANSAGAAGQPSIMWVNGTIITAFPTLVAGTPYFLDAAGVICEYSDLTTGEWVCRVGHAKTTTTFLVSIEYLEIQKA
jgi:hypothetical protein